MKKLMLVWVVGLSWFSVGGMNAMACDGPVIRSVLVIQSQQVTSLSEATMLQERLEKLLEPVAQKVVVCNAELKSAQAQVLQAESALVASDAAMKKNLSSLQILKDALTQSSCQVCVGGRLYDRETVGEVMVSKIAEFKLQSAGAKVLLGELAAAKSTAEQVATKVAKWVAKEKELLAQVSELESEQVAFTAESRLVASRPVPADAAQLADSVEEMLAPAAKPVANAALLAEVDSILNDTGK